MIFADNIPSGSERGDHLGLITRLGFLTRLPRFFRFRVGRSKIEDSEEKYS